MIILDFFATHWDSVLLVVLCVLALTMLYVMGQKKIVYKILYGLVTEAEKQFGGGTGELKQAYVMEKVYGVLPAVLKMIISAEQLGKWVDEALVFAKEKWKKNANIDDYINGGERCPEKTESETRSAEEGELNDYPL